jgi:Xaa-Pro aminopeptidase
MFHKSNRQKLISAVSGGLIVVSAYDKMQKRNDEEFGFVQESSFWWLTGIEYPGWRLIIDPKSGKDWLVAPNVSPSEYLFEGGLSLDTAMKISGVDEVVDYQKGLDLISQLTNDYDSAYTIINQDAGSNIVQNLAPMRLVDLLKRHFDNVHDCSLYIHRLRAIKSASEIKAIKRAVNLTVESFKIVKDIIPKLKYEYQVEAEFTYNFRRHGALGHAYDPIVAGGLNACTLHYSKNNSVIDNGELLLLDIGAQVGGYSADITRTYAVGSPTARQIAIHRAVQTAQTQIIGMLRPGLKFVDYHNQVDVIMQTQISQLGLMGQASDYRRYFPHSIGHGLGVDTHDSLADFDEFMPGMVVTVEPGIYIASEKIGVRIEDDILITESGHENLSAALSTDL